MSQKRRPTPEPRRQDSPTRRVRPYEPPQLQQYGSLKELTRTLSTVTPGDGFGASYAI